MGMKPSPLRDRGDNGSGDDGVTELLLATQTAHHATGSSISNQTDQRKHRFFSKHIALPGLALLVPGSVRD